MNKNDLKISAPFATKYFDETEFVIIIVKFNTFLKLYCFKIT